ncbi:MAG: hypothetical protein M1142_02590 [Patescibacteria group bacterium]|nr:hypothetical protein [Patescibacteria group bacterium]
MSQLQDILIALIAIEFLIIASCILIVTYFFVKTLRSVSETSKSINEKLQMKFVAFIPALLVALIGRIFKKRG